VDSSGSYATLCMAAVDTVVKLLLYNMWRSYWLGKEMLAAEAGPYF